MHNKSKTTFYLWGVNLASISASTFCYIYLSYYIYRISEDVVLSGLVLFAPMLMPVLLVTQVHQLSNRFTPRLLMIWGNVLGGIISALIFTYLDLSPYVVAIAGATLIGTLDSVQRVSRIVAVKDYFCDEEVKLTVPLTLTAQFIAGGLAGGMLALFKDQINPNTALFATIILFSIGIFCAIPLPKIKNEINSQIQVNQKSVWEQFSDLLSHHPVLQRNFFSFILFITFFQGFFNVSRVSLPAHQLNLPSYYVGLLQVVNSGAALVGAIVFYLGTKKSISFTGYRFQILSAAAMVGACASSLVLPSYGLYFCYIFFFELVFFKIQADIVESCPSKSMPLLATIQYASVYIGMMLSILVGNFLVQSFGLLITALAFLFGYIVLKIFLEKKLTTKNVTQKCESLT